MKKRFARIEQTEQGTRITRDHEPPPDDVDIIAWSEAARARWDTPDGLAYQRLRAILNDACIDPAVIQSAQLVRFTQLIRDLFWLAEPGDPPELFMEPLETLMAGMRSRKGGGGRPTNASKAQRWRARYEQLRRTRPSLTAEERYEDIAQEWESAGNAPVSWRGIRNAISKLNAENAGKK